MDFDCGFKQEMMRPKMSRNGDILCYYGQINAETERLFRTNLTRDIRYLIVRSSGGEMFAAKNIGQMLERVQPAIIVDRICASGCAYYFFLPLERKVIKRHSFVGFHGGPPETRDKLFRTAAGAAFFSNATRQDQRRILAKWRDLLNWQNAMLKRTGVNKMLIYWNPAKRIRKDLEPGCHAPNKPIWAPSPKTLKSFGVKGLMSAWYPASYRDMYRFGKEHDPHSCLVP